MAYKLNDLCVALGEYCRDETNGSCQISICPFEDREAFDCTEIHSVDWKDFILSAVKEDEK